MYMHVYVHLFYCLELNIRTALYTLLVQHTVISPTWWRFFMMFCALL